jgi:hypothetical protein
MTFELMSRRNKLAKAMRRTMKRTKNQVGGAKFGMLPLVPDDALRRKQAIVAKIKATFKDSGSVLTSLLNIAETGINERGTGTFQALESWFTIIEHQDELFDLVLEIIKDNVKFTETDIYDSQRIDVINNSLMTSWRYVESIMTLISLARSAGDTPAPTKIEYLYTKDLITLLQFPKRLNNIFVQSLANVFILLKHDKELLGKIKENEVIRGVALDEYRANIYANTYALTSHDPIDGYYLDQPLEEVRGIQANDAFWSGLFDSIATPPPEKLDLIKETTEWKTVAAAVFNWYISVSDMKDYRGSLFNYFNKNTIKHGEPIDLRPDSPEKKYDTVEVYGVPFVEILKAMDIPTLEFILHLAYTISKNEASTIAAITASSA